MEKNNLQMIINDLRHGANDNFNAYLTEFPF